MAEIVKLRAAARTDTGTRQARRLRAQGKIPAVVYGLGADPQAVTVEWRELRLALTTGQAMNAVVHLDVGGQSSPTLVKDLQRHPVRRDVLHVDFLRVDLDVAVEAEVPIVLTGEAIKVRQADGLVEQTLGAVVVAAKPDLIPPQIAVDVSELELGATVRAGELDIPPGVTLVTDANEPVATAIAVFAKPPALEAEAVGDGQAEGEGASAGEG